MGNTLCVQDHSDLVSYTVGASHNHDYRVHSQKTFSHVSAPISLDDEGMFDGNEMILDNILAKQEKQPSQQQMLFKRETPKYVSQQEKYDISAKIPPPPATNKRRNRKRRQQQRPEQAKQSVAQARASLVTSWETMEILREAFNGVDFDRSGKIDVCGFATCLRSCGFEVTLDHATDLFDQISKDGDSLDFYTLRDYLTTHSQGSPLLERIKRQVQHSGADNNYLVYSMVRQDSAQLFDEASDLTNTVLEHRRAEDVERDGALMEQLVGRVQEMY